MTKAQKIILAVILLVILMLIIAIAAFMGTGKVRINKDAGIGKDGETRPSEEMNKRLSKEAAQETQKLLDEVENIASSVNERDIDNEGYAEVVEFEEVDEETGTTTKKSQGVRIAPGANIIKKDTGEVVNDDGKKVDNSAPIGSPDAPRQSQYIHDKEKLPESSIELEIGADYIEPESFTVKSGQAVNLVISAVSDSGALLKFEDPSMGGVAAALMPNRTKTITFNAPDDPGEYKYFSDYGRQKELGAVGIMTVE